MRRREHLYLLMIRSKRGELMPLTYAQNPDELIEQARKTTPGPSAPFAILKLEWGHLAKEHIYCEINGQEVIYRGKSGENK